MRIEGRFLNSRLGRRLFIIFCICALVPLLLTAGVTFIQVKNQLANQNATNLQLISKALGMSVYERMILISGELERTQILLENLPPEKFFVRKDLDSMLFTLIYKDNSKNLKTLLKTKKSKPVPKKYIQNLKSSEKTSIFIEKSESGFSRIFMIKTLDTDKLEPEFLIGEINAEFLWKIGSETTIPPGTELVVIDQSKNIIISSLKNPKNCISAFNSDKTSERQFNWSDNKNHYIARYWTIFMESRFNCEPWTVISSRDKKHFSSSVLFFQKIFPLILILSFLVVIFFSMVNIRKILIPLEKLKSGIKEISNSNLNAKINVKSNDEFQEVAKAFNDMASQLQKHFKAINTNSEIDRAVLSSLEPEIIIQKMLSGILELLFCKSANICLAGHDEQSKGFCFSLSLNKNPELKKEPLFFDENQLKLLLNGKRFVYLKNSPKNNLCITPFISSSNNLAIIPVFIKNNIHAFINLEYPPEILDIGDDIVHAVQLADQMGVALANSNLVSQLDEMAEGTLRALARTVDANSPWTAGHSERVSEMCEKIAQTMKLAPYRIDNIVRAALLHDIGKVGISTTILDKPDKLTDEEYSVIKEHPDMGARILEPIKVYKDVIPIVRQHHEQFDGNGYPDGLLGNEIVIEARIMAVADVYDALISDRPYRKGWDRKKVIDFILEKSGSHFDPQVVKAFKTLILNDEII
jgi:putative nucleotidyltransferase with HDIG domain